MRTNRDLSNAVEEQRHAVAELSEALARYRRGGTSVQEPASALDADGGPVDRYVRASGEVGRIIGEALDASPDDDDAADRLLLAVTVDAKVAEQAALLATMLEPPDPDDAAVLRELTADETDDLGENLAEFAGPLLDEIGREDEPGGEVGAPPTGPERPSPGDYETTDSPEAHARPLQAGAEYGEADAAGEVSAPWPGRMTLRPGLAGGAASSGRVITTFAQDILGQWGAAPARPDAGAGGRGPVTIEPSVRKILDRGAETMVGTAGACVPFAQLVQGHLINGFAIETPLGAALGFLRKGWHALRRLAVRAWQTLMDKLGRWAAPAQQAGAWLNDRIQDFVHDLIVHGVRNVLAGLLDAPQVVDDGDALLAARPAALSACGSVVEHHHQQQRFIRLLNKTLPVIFTCHALAGAGAAAALLIFSVWTAHDHIDSPHLRDIRFPGNPGLLQAIRDAH
jgi:hypothetical protein